RVIRYLAHNFSPRRHKEHQGVQLELRVRSAAGCAQKDGQMTSPYGVRRLVAAFLLTPSTIAATSRRTPKELGSFNFLTKAEPEATRTSNYTPAPFVSGLPGAIGSKV